MSELKLTAAQQTAAIDGAGESMALRSGAGCGKTFVLARRYAQLLTDADPDSAPLRRLAALTFTDKAAIEMSQRVRKMLMTDAKDASGDRKAQLRAWIDELPEARISTIHSFCVSLLRAHAIEAGVDPNFAVCADDLMVSKLLADACDSALLAAAEASDPQLTALLEHLPYPAVLELLTKLVSDRQLLDPDGYRDAGDVLGGWETLLDRHRQAAWGRMDDDAQLANLADSINNEPCGNPSDKLAVKRAEFTAIVNEIIADHSARTPENFDLACGLKIGNIGTKAAWGSREAAMSLRHMIRDLKDLLKEYAPYSQPLNEMDRLSAESLVALANLAEQAGVRYAAAKRTRGLLDFDDLVIAAGDLIRSNPQVRRQLGDGIDQLLIDECQDTDAFQLRMLADLISGGSESASEAFVVGDAKQSIYRFRGADVDEFENICSLLGRGRSESLDLSFRTHAAGVEFVNSLFEPLMGRQYERISAHRGETPPHESVEILLADGQEPIGDADAASAAQAQLTAQRIADMIANKEKLVWDSDCESWRAVQPRDVAILLSRMTHSLEYERQLQRYGVPYYVVAGTGFFKQQEVFDILNALRVIDNPLDDIALLGVLRSSLVALDDNALTHIAELFGGGPYLPKLSACGDELVGRLSDGQIASLRFAVDLLQRLGRCKNAVAIDELMSKLLDETGYPAVLAAQFGPKRLIGNIRQLTDRAAAADRDGMSLRDFIARTDQLILSESRYEQAVVAGESDNVVRLMTIHKAKGLEFGVLVLPDLNAGRRGFVGRLMHRRRDWGWTLNVKPDPDDPDAPHEISPQSFALASIAENQDLASEDIRKLYVAVTRHRDHLVLIGANMRTRDGEIRGSTSPLAQIDEVLGAVAAIDAGQDTIDYADGRFKARIACVLPEEPRTPPTAQTPGRKALTAAAGPGDLASAMLGGKSTLAGPPLLGPLPASIGSVQAAVTALNDFAHCPMLYRWRYELAAPPISSGGGSSRRGSLDALTLGTLYHRCMELLDFANPQANSDLVSQAVWEMDLDDAVDIAALTSELDEMTAKFAKHDLGDRLASAKQVLRELDFILTAGQLTLRGQIDLLYRDEGGDWRIVDYKSDNVAGGEQIAERAANYELQMLAYSLAAGEYLGQPVADASLYFLRPGKLHAFTANAESLQRARDRLAELTEKLLIARRTNSFEEIKSPRCEYCPYSALCRRQT